MAVRSHGGGCVCARSQGGGVAGVCRIGLTVLLSIAACTLSRAARADEAVEFELGKNRFDAGQYEEALQRFSIMLDPAMPPCEKSTKKNGNCRLSDKGLIERARAFAAASLIAQSRKNEADAHIEAIYRSNAAFVPNPALFPPEVIDRFTEVRARIAGEIEAAANKEAEIALQKRLAEQRADEEEKRWLATIERLAGEERVTKKNSRLIALVPLGVGQFQNGQNTLGWIFAATEAFTGITSIVSGGVAGYYSGIDPKIVNEQGQPVDLPALNQKIEIAATINRIAFGAWAALTVAGVLQAQIAFVPQVTTIIKRPTPKRPKASASLRINAGGVFVVGSF